jgi:hypothetical protein
MVVGTLPWDEIMKEVPIAVHHFSLDTLGGDKEFVNVPRLVDWLVDIPTSNLYPHLTGERWGIIENRVTQGMRKLGWRKFARNVFVVPPFVQAAVEAEGAEA